VSTSPIVDDRFIRNPVLQVRAFGASRPVAFFKRYVGPSDSRHPSTVRLAGRFTGAVDSGTAVVDAVLPDVAAFDMRAVFTGADADVRSIEKDAGVGRAADVDDRFRPAVAVVFESGLAVRPDGWDKTWASGGAPAAP
jgi:hypothetical protein